MDVIASAIKCATGTINFNSQILQIVMHIAITNLVIKMIRIF